MRKIAFFWPSEITGGVEFLVKTSVEILSECYSITIYDKKDGWFTKNLSEFTVCEVLEGGKIIIEDDVVLITFGTVVRYLDLYFVGKFKVISWTMHPNNLIPSLPAIPGKKFIENNKLYKKYLWRFVLRGEFDILGRMARYLQYSKSLYMMDEYCSDVLYSTHGVKCSSYLPVVVGKEKNIKQKKIQVFNSIECIWLGRLDGEFKTEILKRVLCDLNVFAFENKKNITFNVVGNGPALEEMKIFSSSLKNITTCFLLEKRGGELQEIIERSMLGFAMGTSAIEIAACHTPCILLDYAYLPVSRDYRYRWIFQSKNFTLGRQIDSQTDKSFGNKLNIDNVIWDVISSRDKLSEMCFDYINKNHAPEALAKNLFAAIENTSSSFVQMSEINLFKKPFWFCMKKAIGK